MYGTSTDEALTQVNTDLILSWNDAQVGTSVLTAQWEGYVNAMPQLKQHAHEVAGRLARQDDLVTQLIHCLSVVEKP